MPQYAILRFAKHKGNPASPLEARHERQKEQYASNPDIDMAKSKYNFHIVKPTGHSRECQPVALSRFDRYTVFIRKSKRIEEVRTWIYDY